jgi:glyoxylase-like metal-dependent hydrolase (beta-lactamase superfamily II)
MPAIIPIPAFTDNYIWLVREGGNAAVVDPGDAAPVLAYLDREGLALTAIVNTHHHGDHVGGNADLLARAPVPVFGPAGETIPGRTQALAVEPGNAALRDRQAREAARREQGVPTVPSTIADELATNPFLRAAEPEVFAAAQAHAGRALADAVESFAELRAWKNAF